MKFMCVKELSERCPWLTPGAIRNLVMRRRIPFRKAGGRLVFIEHEIVQWVENSPGAKVEDVLDEKF